MKSTIFIPKLCKVGFNERSDTYTGMLGYVIYNDGKKWRKEESWKSWIYDYMPAEEVEREKQKQYSDYLTSMLNNVKREQERPNHHNIVDGKLKYYVGGHFTLPAPSPYHAFLDFNSTMESLSKELPYETFIPRLGRKSSNEKIKPIEFENVPMEGFVLNRKTGGYKSGWDVRQTYCRVYDPRGFEFEITIPNLLYILEHSNSIKGKGLEGKFIYGWDGKDLVLVPEASPEFQEMVKFTQLQDGKVLKKEMIRGNVYINNRQQRLTYMGDAFETGWRNTISNKKKIWFWIEADEKVREGSFISYSDVKNIKYSTGEANLDFANLMDSLEKCNSYYPLAKPEFEKVELTEPEIQYFLDNNGNYHCYIKRENSFVHVAVTRKYDRYNYYSNKRQYPVQIHGLERYSPEYESISELLKKYELWQLKMTK